MLGINAWPSAMDPEMVFPCKECQVEVRTRSRIKAKAGRCDRCQAARNKQRGRAHDRKRYRKHRAKP